ALTAHIHDLSGMRASANPNNAWAYPPRDTKNFAFVSGELDSLMLAVDGSDAAPSPDAQRGFEALTPMIDAALKAWDQLKAGEVAAVKHKLKEAGKEHVTVGE